MTYVKEFFHLNDIMVEELYSWKPKFGFNGYGEIVFRRTFSRKKPDNSLESWNDCCLRVINGIMSIRKNHYTQNNIEWNEAHWQQFAGEMLHSMFIMEWLPPGRGLWQCGTQFMYERGSAALNNCFSGDTEFVCGGYLRELKFMHDNEPLPVVVNTLYGPRKATIRKYGKQVLYAFTFSYPGRSKYKFTYKATRNHRWFLSDGTETIALKVGDRVSVKPGNIATDTTEYRRGFVHGLFFADGTKQSSETYRLRLCGWKETYRQKVMASEIYSHTVGKHQLLMVKTCTQLKKLPHHDTLQYKQGFFDAWRMMDGHWKKTSYCIDSIDKEAADWVGRHSGVLNYVMIGHSIENNDTNYGKRNAPLNRIKVRFEEVEYRVDSKVFLSDEEEVYCVNEPETNSFQLAHGIITSNCGFVEVTMATMAEDMCWAADMCMLGVGIGFRLTRNSVRTEVHTPRRTYLHSVADTREGWANSIKLLIAAYLNGADNPEFDYSQLRKLNSPIRGFGGTASGPAPLMELHSRIRKEFGRYITGAIDEIELQANIANAIAVCVLAGNVRRSAEILQCEIEDRTFIELKNRAAKPDRLDISWTSNNSGIFTSQASFNLIGDIAERVVERGEPGGINQMNMIYGRLHPKDIMAVENGQIRRDKARGFNPCGEQQLESRELCCLVNTFPTKCLDRNGRFQQYAWHRALDFATFYASTVTLLPTHDATTNAVMQRNRRIGVAVSDFTGWVHAEKLHNVIDYLKAGYKFVRERNAALADDAGIPHSIRLTTIKPDGTITKLAGVTAGAGYPTFRYTLRRTRFPKVSPITEALKAAGVPWEPDVMQPDTTLIFEYPILQGPAPPVSEVSIWEQVTNIILLQRYWSDNAVSNTIYFEPDEYLIQRINGFVSYSNDELNEIKEHGHTLSGRRIELDKNDSGKSVESRVYQKNVRTETHLIERVISMMMPMVKSFSLLPKSGPGVYPQMPESELTEQEYHERLAAIKPIDWNKVSNSEAVGVKFCSGDECEVISG